MENKMSLKPREALPVAELPVGELPERETPSYPVPHDSWDRRCLPRCLPRSPKFLLLSSEESPSERTKELPKSQVNEAPGTSSKVKEASVKTGPQVYLRLRPVDRRSASYSISADGNTIVATNKSNRMEKRFQFTAIFEDSADQRHIYDTCVGPKICAEESVTVMTYGTSGSGKTFTLLGDDQSAGIIPRALCHIFALRKDKIYTWPFMKVVKGCLAQLQYAAAQKEMEVRAKLLNLCPDLAPGLERKIEEDHAFSAKTSGFSEGALIYVSYVEIYNELVHDLLEVSSKVVPEGPRKNLKLVWNKGEVYVQGLTSVFVQSSEEALRLLRLGRLRSTSAATEVNTNSSRSHCVFILDLIKCNRLGFTAHSTFKFCDLAGSERVKNTGTTGLRLKEAKRINTSLMTLGRCLKAASTGKKLMPIRNSQLTMLLQAALVGKERLSILATVSPVEKSQEENLVVLNFASIAKNIVFKGPVRKQPLTSLADILKLSKMAADNEDREKAMQLEAKNASLELELSSEKRRHEEEKQLLTLEIERLMRIRITDLETTQETKESQSGKVRSARYHCIIS